MTNRKPADGLGTQIRRLLELLDGDLEQIYRADGEGYRPRYTPVMKALADGAGRSIKDIANLSSLSHSAASQTIAQMVREDLAVQEIGADARERLVRLSTRGLGLMQLLRRRWAATQAAADTLDAELSTPLSGLLAEAIEKLTARPFHERIAAAERKLKDPVS